MTIKESFVRCSILLDEDVQSVESTVSRRKRASLSSFLSRLARSLTCCCGDGGDEHEGGSPRIRKRRSSKYQATVIESARDSERESLRRRSGADRDTQRDRDKGVDETYAEPNEYSRLKST